MTIPQQLIPNLDDVVELCEEFGFELNENDESGEILWEMFRAVLARYACPVIHPVPASERLPGPEDCAPWPDQPEARPWCWAAKCVDGGWEWTQLSMLGLSSDTLGRITAGGGWTHWAPHWALPVPAPANNTREEI